MIKKILIFTILGVLLVGILWFANEYMKLRAEMFEVTIAKDDYIQGNPQGDLTVVYFSDYECPACRDFHSILTEAVKQDGNIRLVQRPSPKNEWFHTITAAVYAAGKQDKFYEMNDSVIENWPIFSEDKLFKLAGDLNLDTEQLSRDMKSNEIRQEIAANRKFLTDWNLPEFPALIIWPKRILLPAKSDSMSVERLLDEFKDARSFL